jgi:hypothetical protein
MTTATGDENPGMFLIRGSCVTAVVLMLAACSGGSGGGASSYGAGDPSLAAPNPAGGPVDPFLADGDAVVKALDAVSAHSGTPMRVISMNADTTNGFTVQVQEPANHVNVDQYVIAPDGTLTGPTPVKLANMSGNGPVTAADVDREAFDPKAIQFAKLAQTVKEAIAKSTFPDARVIDWEFDGIGPDDKRYIYLSAARGRPTAIVDKNLKILKINF